MSTIILKNRRETMLTAYFVLVKNTCVWIMMKTKALRNAYEKKKTFLFDIKFAIICVELNIETNEWYKVLLNIAHFLTTVIIKYRQKQSHFSSVIQLCGCNVCGFYFIYDWTGKKNIVTQIEVQIVRKQLIFRAVSFML